MKSFWLDIHPLVFVVWDPWKLINSGTSIKLLLTQLETSKSVHRRFLQHCYDCSVVQVANTESFTTIWGKKTALNIKMKCETTSNWFWKAGAIKSWWGAKDQLLIDWLMTCQSNMTGGNVHARSPRWRRQFERKMSQIDEELLSLDKELPTHPFGIWF